MDNYSSSSMTVEELCEELLIGKNLAYKLLANGSIKAFVSGAFGKFLVRVFTTLLIKKETLLPKNESKYAQRFCIAFYERPFS